MEVCLKTSEHENSGSVVFLISNYLQCETPYEGQRA